jgi:S-DNA-T family DNA segregation ATPase FtsK/SpoIIIE
MARRTVKKSKGTNKRSRSKASGHEQLAVRIEIAGIVLVGFAAYLMLSLTAPFVSGQAGYFFEGGLIKLLGDAAFLFPIYIGSAGVLVFVVAREVVKRDDALFIFLWLNIVFGVLVSIFSLSSIEGDAVVGIDGHGGGIIGDFLLQAIFNLIGLAGYYLLLCILFTVLVWSCKSRFFIKLKFPKKAWLGKFKTKTDIHDKKEQHKEAGCKTDVLADLPKPFDFDTVRELNSDEDIDLTALIKENPDAGLVEIKERVREVRKSSRQKAGDAKEKEIIKSAEVAVKERVSSGGTIKPKGFLPPIELLDDYNSHALTLGSDLQAQSKLIEETLLSFGVKATVKNVTDGPSILRFELQLAPGIKVSKILALADDLALSLAAADVRIEAPIPGKAAVGIEVPKLNKTPVSLREMIESDVFQKAESPLTVCLGKDVAGTPIVTDLASLPHLLVAGATGSGKSVCINGIINSILYKASHLQVKMLLIDPKMVELGVYNGIPHLMVPVVNDAKKAASALKWMTKEMERRYRLFADSETRDIKGYNKDKSYIDEDYLAHVLVIIDELADLIMVAPADVEDAICRLAQMARAAGIHLVVATQRPSVDVITGLIKANIPSRLSFSVSSQIDSRTILDMPGAEKLVGKGDMLFLPVGKSRPLRVQGAFLSEQEASRVVSYIKNFDYSSELETQVIPEFEEIATTETDKRYDDDLFETAAKLVVEARQASISLLQRRLRVGYARAARLIDMLEEAGFIGGFDGSRPREVFLGEHELEERLGNRGQ